MPATAAAATSGTATEVEQRYKLDLLGRKPSEMTPEERRTAITGYELRHRIEALVQGITSKALQHVYTGTGAATGHDIMILPRLPATYLFSRREVDVILGYTAHEISHQLRTDFDLLTTLFADINKPTAKELQVKEWWNAIEDYRIEKVVRTEYPGFPLIIEATRDHTTRRFCNNVEEGHYSAADLANPFRLGAVALTWIGGKMNGYKTKAHEDALALIDPQLRLWLEAWSNDMAAVTTCVEARDLAIRIVDALEQAQQGAPGGKGQSGNTTDQKQDQTSGDTDAAGEDAGNGPSKGSGDGDSSEETPADSSSTAESSEDESEPSEAEDQDAGGDAPGEGDQGQDASANGAESAPEPEIEADAENASADGGSQGANTGAQTDPSGEEEGAPEGGADEQETSSQKDESGSTDDATGSSHCSSDPTSSLESSKSGDQPGEASGADGATSDEDAGTSAPGEGTPAPQGDENKGSASASSQEQGGADQAQKGQAGQRTEDNLPHLDVPANAESAEPENADLSIEEIMDAIEQAIEQLGDEAASIEVDMPMNKGAVEARSDREAMEQRVIGEQGAAAYAAARQQLGAAAARSAAILRRVLQAQKKTRIRRGREDGDLDMSRLVPIALGASDVYTERQNRRQVNTAVSLLLDNSGSMGGHNLEVCQKAAIILDNVLKTNKTAFEATGYTSRAGGVVIYRYRNFNDSDVQAARALGSIPFVPLGSTPTGVPVLDAWRRLRVRPEPRKIMIIVTDGGADDPQLARQAHDIAVMQGCTVFGIAIGVADYMQEWCDNVVSISDAHELPEALTQLVKDLVR